MFEGQDVLDLALTVAYGFVYCGAETYRAEDSAMRILSAYGCENIEVLALANFVTITFVLGAENFHGQKRIFTTSNNMRKLEFLNSETREIVETRPNPQETISKIQAILTEKTRPFSKQVAITGFIGFTFTLLLGGSFPAAIFAFVVDMFTRIILEPMYRHNTNRLFVNVLGGLLVVLLAWPSQFFSIGEEQAKIVSGSFMFLFPGVSLVNSIRDIIASDYIAGLTKLVETFLVAIGIAIGSGFGLSIIQMFS